MDFRTVFVLLLERKPEHNERTLMNGSSVNGLGVHFSHGSRNVSGSDSTTANAFNCHFSHLFLFGHLLQKYMGNLVEQFMVPKLLEQDD